MSQTMAKTRPKVQFKFTKPQFSFIRSKALFPALVGGYGSGKTFAGTGRAMHLKMKYPDQNVAYYLPTYDLITQIAIPRFAEMLTDMNLLYVINKADKTIKIVGMKGTIIMRTMDQPERIVGYEVGHSICDELDTLKTDKAAEVWRKIVARNRQKLPDGAPNTVGVTTTPEGFRFVYENWHRKPFKGSELIKASTYSNAKNLPAGYIDQLKATFPDNMLQAYLEGEFVNLTQGSVYAEFDRVKNACKTKPRRGETLHVGMDFNVGQMAATIHVMRDRDPHAVDEFTQVLDTPALIRAIQRKYVEIEDPCSIIVYPDATGKSRKSQNASESDIALLNQAGFKVMANKSNPFIKDRVASVNKLINKAGKRRYKVNVDRCPHLVECLEKQAYDKNGEPDKTSGFDHAVDSTGYFIAYRYPVASGRSRKIKLKGI